MDFRAKGCIVITQNDFYTGFTGSQCDGNELNLNNVIGFKKYFWSRKVNNLLTSCQGVGGDKIIFFQGSFYFQLKPAGRANMITVSEHVYDIWGPKIGQDYLDTLRKMLQ